NALTCFPGSPAIIASTSAVSISCPFGQRKPLFLSNWMMLLTFATRHWEHGISGGCQLALVALAYWKLTCFPWKQTSQYALTPVILPLFIFSISERYLLP